MVYMILIIDNGKGAQEVSAFLRVKNSVVKPNQITAKAAGYVISDGKLSKDSQKIIADLLKKTDKPVLGIGLGHAYVAAAFGAAIKENKRPHKQDSVAIKKPCPLLLDLKKVFTVMDECNYIFEELPENFSVAGSSSKHEFEVIQHAESPFFGVHFNPELGMEGRKVLDNFSRFINMWETHHK
ncbi:MAG: hypothetical protein J4469_02865 [Candidatus Aenigmarchaeota archaeon]|nr:hypothetical protein [Candidatus Aenigmarchaeota archaeon]